MRIFEIGSDGYRLPDDPEASDGPAQVHPLDVVGIPTAMHTNWYVFKWTKLGEQYEVFPPVPAVPLVELTRWRGWST